MKTLMGLIMSALLISTAAFADNSTQQCYGTVYLPSQFVSGNCNHGFCTGTVNADSVSVSGNCSDQVTFTADGWTGSDIFHGNCQGGFLHGSINESMISFDGTCSNGKRFSGTAYPGLVIVDGSCRMSGFFDANVVGGSAQVEGTCN